LPAMKRKGTSHQRYIGTMMGSGVVMKPAESIMNLKTRRNGTQGGRVRGRGYAVCKADHEPEKMRARGAYGEVGSGL